MKTQRLPACATIPFTIAIDHRELAGGYRFEGLQSTSKRQRILILPYEVKRLITGDYSIVGLEEQIAIERKSLPDLYATLGNRREAFRNEHERMATMTYAAVVIEADLALALARPPMRSRLHPRSVLGTALSWQIRFGVPWHFIGSRRLTEIVTFKLLYKFHQQYTESKTHGNS